MKLELDKESQEKVNLALRICKESNERMNSYTEAQRTELEKEGRRLIAKGKN